MMKKMPSFLPWYVALLVAAIALLYFESDFLWNVQEKNLFLASSLFFSEQMVVPGGLLSWAGTFFTQFFYYPWLGVSMLCGWWLLLMWLTQRAFRLPDQWLSLLLVPVAMLLLTIVDMGYWLYVLKLQGHVFVATLGTTVVVALLWAFRSLPAPHYLRPLFLFVVSAVGYPLLGIYALAATLLMAVWSWRLKGKAVACSVVAVLSVVAVPLLYYRYVFWQTNLANIYYAGLPLYYITEEYHAYYVPFYLLALFYLLLVAVPVPTVKPVKALVAQALVAVLLIGGVAHFWYRDENFHHEMSMMRSIEQHDWQAVVEEAARQEDEPTRAIVMMRNLALSRLGRQGNDMFLYKNGSKRYEAPFDMRLMLAVGPQMYYHYGMLNYCARLSTEMGVEFGWRSENLKLLALCAILNGEQQHARKYLGLLRQTLFFRQWGQEAGQWVGDTAAIARNKELSAVAHMMHYDNRLSSDQGYIESFLMQQLANSRYTGDPVFQEQTLLATLWTKDATQFWRHFQDYIRLHPTDPMPRYYQEAAYLYTKLAGREDLEQLPFDMNVKESFNQFMKAAAPYNNADVDVARKALGFFSQTYYYDYYLMQQLPEY
jgi:hypothetical protein